MHNSISTSQDSKERAASGSALTAEQARQVIEAHDGALLTVYFTKRTPGPDGQRRRRRMLCLYNEERAEQARFRFNPAEKQLLAVWDCEKGARRFISLDGDVQIFKEGRELRPERATPSRKSPAQMNFEELQAEADRLFGF